MNIKVNYSSGFASPEALFRSAYLAHQKGDLAQAERLYRQTLQFQPKHAPALHLLGVLHAQAGQFKEAASFIAKAVRLAPNDFSMQNNLGNALVKTERCAEALKALDKALALQPNSPQVLNNRGNALYGLKRYGEAVESYLKAIEFNPQHVEAMCNLGKAYTSLARHQDALDIAEKALALAPDSFAAKTVRGNAYVHMHRTQDAMRSFGEVLYVDDTYADAHWGRGLALMQLRQYTMAAESFTKALALNDGLTDVYAELAEAEFHAGRNGAAVTAIGKALERQPNNMKWLVGQVSIQAKVCDWTDIEAKIARVKASVADGSSNDISPFHVLGISDDPAINRKVAEYVAKGVYPANSQLGPVPTPAPGKRTRIGYFSADLRQHAVGHLVVDMLEQHDRERFEVIAFYFGRHGEGDFIQPRIKAVVDQFIDVNDKSDQEIAQMAREMGIEVAVDLMGYTKDCRPDVFALRAAPVQVNYLGFPGTSGAEYMDYILADGVVIPPENRDFFVEKVVALPNAYQPNDRQRPVAANTPTREALGLPSEGFVFACFNQNYKIQPATFRVWMRVLQQVPGSVLWLLQSTDEVAANLRREAERLGVDGARLVFAPNVPMADHLARQRQADLFLDTLPYNAHTTTSDALWVGLPVLTLRGESFAGRVAASLLQAAGLPELITTTPEAYEALAVQLAQNPGQLKALRDRLVANRDTCALFDTPRMARDVERAFDAMVERSRQGLAPDHIVLDAA